MDEMISYAHCIGPRSQRFVQMAKDPLPVWAVDVKPYVKTKDLYYPGFVTIKDVIEEGFSNFDNPKAAIHEEGFEYVVGKIRGGKVKVVFEPDSPDYLSTVIEEGFIMVAEA